MSRTGEIAQVLGKYGLDWLAHSDSPWHVVALPKQWFHRPEPDHTQAERVRLALEELGPTFIKLGQAVSTRTDLVPAKYVEELSKLQDSAPEVPYDQIAEVIREDLGQEPELIFAEIDPKPLAAASISQVHDAVLSDGTQVVVKVQRPGAQQRVENDLLVLAEVADLLEKHTELGKRYDLTEWLQEFGFSIRNELDFRREGRNADRFRENFLGDATVHVPRVFWKYTTRRVLVTEKVVGMKINDPVALEEAGVSPLLLAETCARVVLTEIFQHGFFHADPHPGNFFVLPNGTLAIIDFGMVGRIDEATRESLMRVTMAIGNEDANALADELMVIGVPRGTVDIRDLRLDLDRLLELHVDGPPEQFSLAQMFNDTLAAAADHNIRMASNLLLLVRAITMAEGIGGTLSPDFRMMDFSRGFLRGYFTESHSPKAMLKRSQQSSLELTELALEMPHTARRLVGQLERGEIRFVTRLEKLDDMIANIHRAANRLSMSILVAALILGLCFLMLAVPPSQRAGLPGVFLNGMLIMVVVGGVAVLVSIYRGTKT